MSLTCLQLIKGAMRKLGVLAIGREPTSAQAEDSMEVLTSFYLELIGQGVFGKLIDSYVTDAAYTAHENERITCSSVVTTVTLPTTITAEWWPVQGNIGGIYDYGWNNTSASATYPRTPRDGAVVQIARSDLGTALTYIHDAPKAAWVSIDSLALATAAPLSERYGEALKALLAIKFAPHYNVQPNPFLERESAKANSMLSHRFDRGYRPVSGNYY
jgi:hypothetical protein